MSISVGNEQYRERILVHQESHEDLCGCCVEGFEEGNDSVKVIGSMEVGVTCEEPNVLELDEYAEELHSVFDSMSGVSC